MENFIAYNPTTLHFGKDVTGELGKTIEKYGKRVLLIYGKGSIKKNGVYNRVMEQLERIGAVVWEYGGIKPNPVTTDVDAAAVFGRENNVDVILAVGGGSVIDSAKMVSLAITTGERSWKIMTKEVKPVSAVPLVTVLTIAATGTEMNPFAVLQDEQSKKKTGYGHHLIYPKHSFLDPTFTFSVPRDQTAYGIADLVAHALENFFGAGEASLSDKFVFSIIKEAMEYGPALLSDLQDYNLRAKIMYAATMALNGLTAYGRVSGDWGVHDTGHILSVLYDLPHGATLSVAYPAWMKLMKNRAGKRIEMLGENLFGTDSPVKTIDMFEKFFYDISCPVNMKSLGISRDKRDEIINLMIKNRVNGLNYKMDIDDYANVVDLMFTGT